jgi:peptidoglycan/xylan/chitin deacetylase (PgdA/CDA1 family)
MAKSFLTKIIFYSIIKKKMKKPLALELLLLVFGLILSACVSRPALTVIEESVSVITVPVPEPVIDTPVPVIAPPEIILSPLEQLRLRIQQNGSDIEKQFVLSNNGQIIVKAEFRDGVNRYEVTYDLENIRVLDSSVYEVDFVIDEINTGTRLRDTLIWRPVPGKEGLLLAMDDNFMENWEQYFNFFDEYNAKITFFVQGDPRVASDPRIASDPRVTSEPEPPDEPELASTYSVLLSFSHNALNRGHDVGYHSLNHLDLRRVSRETLNRETIEPLEFFRQDGIPILSFAYPYGFSEIWLHEILLQSYSILRGYGTTFRLYSEEQIRAGYVISRAIDNTVIQGDANFQRTILMMLRTVKFLNDGRILPLTTHIISNTAAYGISPSRLEFLFKAVLELQLNFYRYSDFIDY